jgi:AAA domain
MADGAAPVRLPLIELMGPAGAGKSTVFQSLLGRDPTILETPTVWKKRYAAIVAVNLVGVVATLIRHGVIRPKGGTEQLGVMTYVQTLPRVLRELSSAGNSAMVFDQGPLFLLTRHNFMSEPLVTWWNRMIDTWAPLLDVVVRLDAPDTLLRERINMREKSHALKGADGRSALDVLRSSRQVYERSVEAVTARPGGPMVLRFDTSTRSPDEIADAILSVIRAGADSDPHARVEMSRLRSGQ